jgi:hypothetical protein
MFWVPLENGRYDLDLLTPWFALPEFTDMAVNEAVRKCVLFLGTKEKGKFRPRATAFVVSIRAEIDIGWRYLVTAEHVVSGLVSRGHEIWVRSNLKDGTASENKLSNGRWWYHPNNENEPTDVALAPVDFSPDEDFLAIPLNSDTSMAATDLVMMGRISVGHEVYITGLFRSHYGRQQNVPIVRIGNLAMMRGEKVYTEYCGYIDAYLIEARSISGLSGSPVFLNIPFLERTPNIGLAVQNERTHLLGLMHGHFDVKNFKDDIVIDADQQDGTISGINTGIGVVIPVEKILETLEHPELVEMRRKAVEELRKQQGATADSDASDAASGEENPQHLEDFKRLVDVAARKRPRRSNIAACEWRKLRR